MYLFFNLPIPRPVQQLIQMLLSTYQKKC